MEFGEALEETVRTMGLRQLKSKQVAKFGYFALSMDRDSRLVIPLMHASWRDNTAGRQF